MQEREVYCLIRQSTAWLPDKFIFVFIFADSISCIRLLLLNAMLNYTLRFVLVSRLTQLILVAMSIVDLIVVPRSYQLAANRFIK